MKWYRSNEKWVFFLPIMNDLVIDIEKKRIYYWRTMIIKDIVKRGHWLNFFNYMYDYYEMIRRYIRKIMVLVNVIFITSVIHRFMVVSAHVCAYIIIILSHLAFIENSSIHIQFLIYKHALYPTYTNKNEYSFLRSFR